MKINVVCVLRVRILQQSITLSLERAQDLFILSFDLTKPKMEIKIKRMVIVQAILFYIRRHDYPAPLLSVGEK